MKLLNIYIFGTFVIIFISGIINNLSIDEYKIKKNNILETEQYIYKYLNENEYDIQYINKKLKELFKYGIMDNKNDMIINNANIRYGLNINNAYSQLSIYQNNIMNIINDRKQQSINKLIVYIRLHLYNYNLEFINNKLNEINKLNLSITFTRNEIPVIQLKADENLNILDIIEKRLTAEKEQELNIGIIVKNADLHQRHIDSFKNHIRLIFKSLN
jgi:uncharacterized protein YqgQ